jgi:hypothetical protein
MKSRIYVFFAVALIALGVAALGGCRSEGAVAAGATSSEATAFVPTLSQVAKAVSLNDDEEKVVSAALTEWRETVAERTDKPFRGYRAGMEFVADVAPTLDNEQISDLVEFLGEYRDEHRKDMKPAFRGKRHGSARHEKIAEELGLSVVQKKEMKSLHSETRKAMREQREAFEAGKITEAQMKETARAVHEAQKEKVTDILTEEQLSKMEDMREEHRTQRIDRRIEHMDERVDARVEWLTAVLELTADQRASLDAALEASAAERKAALEAARDGSASRKEARVELREHHESMVKTLEGILSPEQSERLEIVKRLHPRETRGMPYNLMRK